MTNAELDTQTEFVRFLPTNQIHSTLMSIKWEGDAIVGVQQQAIDNGSRPMLRKAIHNPKQSWFDVSAVSKSLARLNLHVSNRSKL